MPKKKKKKNKKQKKPQKTKKNKKQKTKKQNKKKTSIEPNFYPVIHRMLVINLLLSREYFELGRTDGEIEITKTLKGKKPTIVLPVFITHMQC